MDMRSLWIATAGAPLGLPPPDRDLTVDVAIVGGGITGITAAQLLSEAGLSVAVLEQDEIGAGTTGHSTGNLYGIVDSRLFGVADKWDEDTMRAVAAARLHAVDVIEKNTLRFGIDCGFARVPLHLYAMVGATPEERDQVAKEADAAARAGMRSQVVGTLPLPFPVDVAARIDFQAQLHPLRYVRGIARAIASDRCRLFEHAPVTSIDADGPSVVVPGARVRAKKILLATHTPKGFNILQTELTVWREYGVAMRIADESLPQGIWWGRGEIAHSLRTFRDGGDVWLMAVGEKHKTGQETDTGVHLDRLEAFLRRWFGAGPAERRWSAQHYKPADFLPFIGPSVGSDDVFVATGFSTDGLTWGTLAATLICDEITGRDNPWSRTFAARRFTPVKSARQFAEEQADVTAHLVRDRLTPAEAKAIAEVPRGDGRIVDVDGHKTAVHVDADGVPHLLSPVCTHLKCIVHWNRAESSWDCPCHGSRFGVDGRVLEGPALAPLSQRQAKSDA